MAEMITVLSTNLFRTFILKRFMSIFFEINIEEKGKERICYFVFFSLTVLVHSFFHFPVLNIITNLLLIYFITRLYVGVEKKKVLVTLLIYGINMFCDIIAVYSFGNYMVGEEANGMTVYITTFLILICEFVVERFLVKNKSKDFIPFHGNILIAIPAKVRHFPHTQYTFHGNILIAIPAISIMILLILVMNNLNSRMILISVSVGILLINLLIFYLYGVLVDAYLKLEERALFERQIASYANQLNIMTQTEEKVRTLKHDMKHHLNELMILARHQNDDKVMDYICDMQAYLENPHEYISSGNQEVDSLMNYMLNRAKTVLNHVNYEINIPKELAIRSFDLNVIVGNLLENAIESAEQSKERWLELFLNYERGMLFIRVRNSYDNAIKRKGEIYITTKKEKRIHGIGLQNVKNVVDTYKGDMQISDKDNIFDVKIILYALL
ncbi:ATP-binding protein [Lachnospiraceae bacterium]|nr:ATP-binding protein [Lachnospiraceae bacterium]